jgi:cytidine deaminase
MPPRKTEIDLDRAALADAARKVRELAYAPYSKYKVGAALLAADGTIYTGCNVENAAYPATMCAERNAIHHAVAEGRRKFVAIAVATANGGTPCGTCRQVMREFSPRSDLLVIMVDPRRITAECTLADLLPDSFGPEHLKK